MIQWLESKYTGKHWGEAKIKKSLTPKRKEINNRDRQSIIATIGRSGEGAKFNEPFPAQTRSQCENSFASKKDIL